MMRAWGTGLLLVIALVLISSAASAGSFSWKIRNISGTTVDMEIHSKQRNAVWPGHGVVWILPNNGYTYTNRVSCNRGEKMCYGAWFARDPGTTYGIGHGDKGCTQCCYTCNGGYSRVVTFDPAR